MNVWLCGGCNHELLAKENPLFCEWCGSQAFKDLGEDVIHKAWKKGREKVIKEFLDDDGTG